MKSATANPELRDFHRFVGETLRNGSAHLSPEEALKEWREQHAEPGEFDDDTAAIEEALEDMANGDRGQPADEFLADLRRRIKRKIKNQ